MNMTMDRILEKAYKDGYAIPAINASNMETIMAVFEGAEDERSPIILQIAPIQISSQKIDYNTFASLVRRIAENYSVDYTLHLDHGDSIEDCIEAIKAGFDSVMYDGSKGELVKNIEESRILQKKCMESKISLECELGQFGGAEGTGNIGGVTYTDIEELRTFVKNVEPTSMAVGIGNAHGFYKGEPKLNFELLKDINKEVGIPLVLHGGTGIPESHIKKAVTLGVSKINFFSEIDRSYTDGFLEYMKDNRNGYMMLANEYARQKMVEAVKEKIKLCNSGGRL